MSVVAAQSASPACRCVCRPYPVSADHTRGAERVAVHREQCPNDATRAAERVALRRAAQAPRGEGHGGRGRVTGGAEERDLLAARDGVHRVDGRDACPTPAPTRDAVRGVRGQPGVTSPSGCLGRRGSRSVAHRRQREPRAGPTRRRAGYRSGSSPGGKCGRRG